MRAFLAAAALAASALAAPAGAVDLTGAGATFPYPVYAKWAAAYHKETGVALNYQSIGSGGGIKQITAKTVDFGASDAPLRPEELDRNGLVQFPAIMGGVVPVYNIRGIEPGRLRLTGALLAQIYLGKVSKWSDPRIAGLNPGLKLPDAAISVVHRADGSGTTFLFTNYLSKVSPDWKSAAGEGTAVKWATGVGGKGNEGVANYVSRIQGAIGYVEYAYAKQNRLAHALLQNRDGEFVAPDQESFKAAAAGADWAKAPGMYLILTDQAGKRTWPITGASFILLQKRQERPENGREVLKFFSWAFRNGGAMAADLDYVPIPETVVKLIETQWKSTLKDASGKPVY